MSRCLTDEQLLRFVDDALSVEEAEGVRAHLGGCAACRAKEASLRTLLGDIQAPVGARSDVRAHVEGVMARIDALPATRPEPGRRWLRAGSFAVAVAAALLVVVGFGRRHTERADAWQARGGGADAGIARDVGVRPYAVRGGLHALRDGATLNGDTLLTAGFRNVGSAPVFLLFFAIDARAQVHWISPAYERPTDDPGSTPLPVTVNERLLETTASLEDVAPGPLRIVAVVTATPAHVSDIESLAGDALNADGIGRRLPGASIHETHVTAQGDDGGARP